MFYLNKFDYTKVATIGWFVAYFGSVLVLLYTLFKYHQYRQQLAGRSGSVGVGSILSIALLDSTLHRVAWSLLGPKLWVLMFAWLAGVGIGRILKSRQAVSVVPLRGSLNIH